MSEEKEEQIPNEKPTPPKPAAPKPALKKPPTHSFTPKPNNFSSPKMGTSSRKGNAYKGGGIKKGK